MIAIVAFFVRLLGWQALVDGQPILLFVVLCVISSVPVAAVRHHIQHSERKLARLGTWEAQLREDVAKAKLTS
jgi:hypothetical protein